MNVLSLFSGIGGMCLGFERAGHTIVGQVERDPYCLKVLEKHWPDVPRHDEVCTALQWWRSEPRPEVDVIEAGAPCQPVSLAGKALAEKDERWLWPELLEIVCEIRPRYAVLENVPGLAQRGLADILGSLADNGFDAEWGVLPAAAVGAPHLRRRIFIVASNPSLVAERESPNETIAIADGWKTWEELGGGSWWEAEPRVRRVDDGVPDGVERRRALGNAVVPQVAQLVASMLDS